MKSLLVGYTHCFIHLPIGILLLVALFEFLARNEKYAVLRPAIIKMAFWGMVSSIFSCVAGYLLSKSGGYEKDLLAWHKWFGIALAVIATAFYFFKKIEIEFKQFGLYSSIIFTIMLSATGHLGGALTHGEDFLTQPLLSMFGAAPVKWLESPLPMLMRHWFTKILSNPF